MVEVITQFFVELCEETILDQGRWSSIYTWLALSGVRDAFQRVMVERTWPPEKPTATTPSSLPFVRNFGWIIEVVVILRVGYVVFDIC